jgi:hypothetical protein
MVRLDFAAFEKIKLLKGTHGGTIPPNYPKRG